MDRSLRPAGLAMSLIGNLLFAFGFGGLMSHVATWDGDVASLESLVAVGRPLSMLGVGYLLARFAPRFGGGSLGVQFFVIGVTSMWAAFHATDGVERLVSGMIGGSFLLASVLGLVGIAAAYGWKHSLTHTTPVVLRAGAVPQPFNAVNLAEALKQVSDARSSTVQPDALTPAQRAEVLARLEQLHSSGTLSAEQVAAIKTWWGSGKS